jgi:HSP20 family molecular chaperone IbpA
MAEEKETKFRVTLYDARKEFIVTTDLSGVPKEKILINATNQVLEICVEGEENVLEFCRFVTFPEEVDPGGAVATLSRDGVLQVKVPKKTPRKEIKLYRIHVS